MFGATATASAAVAPTRLLAVPIALATGVMFGATATASAAVAPTRLLAVPMALATGAVTSATDGEADAVVPTACADVRLIWSVRDETAEASGTGADAGSDPWASGAVTSPVAAVDGGPAGAGTGVAGAAGAALRG
ncbi:hypothetical protein GCM10027449_15250 [Sinomonas notoginsengisoli]|uniref:hypothetical protein n=1 Tax=Sinomonas notoginsengisoli TaxID=1457311 RepID=UPI001F1CC699|nr:hypothetical protein [Sinomonas notoginsengisoli]